MQTALGRRTQSQRTGWAGTTHYSPTLGEMAQSSAEAVDVWRQRVARGEAGEIELRRAHDTAALYSYLAATYGPEVKASSLRQGEIAAARVEAFLLSRV